MKKKKILYVVIKENGILSRQMQLAAMAWSFDSRQVRLRLGACVWISSTKFSEGKFSIQNDEVEKALWEMRDLKVGEMEIKNGNSWSSVKNIMK